MKIKYRIIEEILVVTSQSINYHNISNLGLFDTEEEAINMISKLKQGMYKVEKIFIVL
jgi:hypothetical protein